MVEIEDLTQFRFYKLKPQWQKKCINIIYEDEIGQKFCNGYLWMFRTNGSIKLRCNHVDCRSEYLIPRICSNCNAEYKFDSLTCDNCEPLVIQTAQYHLRIEESVKHVKKINKHYRAGDINEKDWKNALELNRIEEDSCIKRLEKLKEENPIIAKHLRNLIIQQ